MNCKFCKADCCSRGLNRDAAFCAGWVKMTNADCIRAMSDEELAELFTCMDMFCCPVTGATCHKEPSCKDCFERWLKKTAKGW